MKKSFRVILIICLSVVLFLVSGYYLLAFYYRNGFSVNTWINGVYCTGKSVNEVNSELLSSMKAPIVVLTDSEGKVYELNLADADYNEDYLTALNNYMKEQNSYRWIDNVTVHRNHSLTPEISYNEDLLKEKFYELDPIKEELKKKADYFIVWSQDSEGYKLHDNLSGRMDVEKAYLAVVDAIDAGEVNIDLSTLDCYYDIPLKDNQKETKILWEKIKYFQDCDLIYDMGTEKIEFTSQIMADFILKEGALGIPVLDENGALMLDKKAVESFVAALAEDYDTYGKEREFLSTRGELVTLKKGTYGTTINQKAEVTFLMEQLLLPDMHTGNKKEHIPEYKREAYVRGVDDIGGTYIEVDMTLQKMYYYVDYELQIETDIVTGNTKRRMGTPEGIYYIYNKQTNRTLRGPGYATFVKFWMPANGNIGIHDAGWRDEFGGEIYKKDGSHGCVNTPEEKMETLYEMVEIGTPVIMFY